MQCLCLLALSWLAEPAGSPSVPSECPTVIPTCIKPAAASVEASIPCATKPDSASGSFSPKPWLSVWECATREIPDRGRSQRDEFRRQLRETFNEHILAAAEQLTGRVTARQLEQNFTWRVVSCYHDTVTLEGVPRDELEQLFYASIQVRQSTRTGMPEQLLIVNRNQPPRTVWQASPLQAENPIQLVRYENGVPPAPSATIRTANVRND